MKGFLQSLHRNKKNIWFQSWAIMVNSPNMVVPFPRACIINFHHAGESYEKMGNVGIKLWWAQKKMMYEALEMTRKDETHPWQSRERPDLDKMGNQTPLGSIISQHFPPQPSHSLQTTLGTCPVKHGQPPANLQPSPPEEGWEWRFQIERSGRCHQRWATHKPRDSSDPRPPGKFTINGSLLFSISLSFRLQLSLAMRAVQARTL